MTVPFTIYSKRETAQVVSPFDPAVSQSSSQADAWDRYKKGDLSVARSLTSCEGATSFEVRGLGPLEVRQLLPFLPELSAESLDYVRAVQQAEADKTEVPASVLAPPEFMAYVAERFRWYARAGIVRIVANAPAGWERAERERRVGLTLWSEETIAGLPDDTVQWLGKVVMGLTHSATEEKKSGSG